MDYTAAFAISAAGMTVERQRVEVAALNLANANTIKAAGEASYQPLRVIVRTSAAAQAAFAGAMGSAEASRAMGSAEASRAMGSAETSRAMGSAQTSRLNVAALAPTYEVVTAELAPRMVHDPGHPMADARGSVAYPAVDSATEMVSLMSATRAYEANVAAMNASRVLAMKALDIGGNV